MPATSYAGIFDGLGSIAAHIFRMDRRVTHRLIVSGPVQSANGPTVIAVPIRNEVERIETCLDALAAQTHVPDVVVAYLNDCDDGTEATARKMRPRLPFFLDLAPVTLPPRWANAGNARRLAMRRAATHAGRHGALLTTDADAIVPSDWIARNLAGLAKGVDAVCGQIVIDALDAAAIPQTLHDDDALECEFDDLLDQIAFSVDPEPHDPRPRHWQASGASLAVSAEAFRRVGGVPPVASGEDRALIEALARIDARVRHEPEIVVVVSGRLDGRATGGMSDTIRRRMIAQDEDCDDLVEPAADRFRRIDFRRRTRLAWRNLPNTRAELAADLGLARPRLDRLLAEPYFGRAWANIQEASPILIRRKVKFVDLPHQIERARHFLAPRHHSARVRESASIIPTRAEACMTSWDE